MRRTKSDFKVGDVVRWDPEWTSNFIPFMQNGLGYGPFEIVKINGEHGHMYIKPLPGTVLGNDSEVSSGQAFSVSPGNIVVDQFLTAAYKATHDPEAR